MNGKKNTNRSENMKKSTLSPWRRDGRYYESKPNDPEGSYGRHSRFRITKHQNGSETFWLLDDQNGGTPPYGLDFDTLADAKAAAENLNR